MLLSRCNSNVPASHLTWPQVFVLHRNFVLCRQRTVICTFTLLARSINLRKTSLHITSVLKFVKIRHKSESRSQLRIEWFLWDNQKHTIKHTQSDLINELQRTYITSLLYCNKKHYFSVWSSWYAHGILSASQQCQCGSNNYLSHTNVSIPAFYLVMFVSLWGRFVKILRKLNIPSMIMRCLRMILQQDIWSKI